MELANSFAKSFVVVGNGMVGQRFCERLVEFDADKHYRVITFCEEPRAAYDRMGLTSFFAHRDAEKLMLARREWYADNGVELHVGDRACAIDRHQQVARSEKGVQIEYEYVVLATGSIPFVPPVPGIDKPGVFVYRTIEDLENIPRCAARAALCGDRRRIIGSGSGQSGIRPRPADARRRVRPAPHPWFDPYSHPPAYKGAAVSVRAIS